MPSCVGCVTMISLFIHYMIIVAYYAGTEVNAMKIIIAGDGVVGDSLTRQLAKEGYDLTLIDSNEKVLEASVDRYDVMAVSGNCAAMDVLSQAGVKDADLLITVTRSDEVNLLSCMTAHVLNPRLQTIARIRNPEYTDQIYAMSDSFALSFVVNPERQAATEMDRLLKYPGFLKRETFAKGRVEIVELRIDDDSRLKDMPLSAINDIVGCRVLVCTVLRDGKAITPGGNFVLNSGDRIFVTAPSANLEKLLKNLGIITRRISRVMLVGGGRISYYLARVLHDRGVSITIVEPDHDRCMELSALLPNAVLVCGDYNDRRLLEAEGLAYCDALVTLTDSDETNLIVSLLGHSLGVRRIITKLDRSENAGLLGGLPVGSTVSPGELCCNSIARYVRAMRDQTGAAVAVHTIADGQAEAAEFYVDADTKNCGVPLKSLKVKKGVLLASITRGSHTEIPNGDSVFKQGDSLVVITSGGDVIYRLNDIFE